MPWQYETPPELTTPTAKHEDYRRTMASREHALAEEGWRQVTEVDDKQLETQLRSRFPMMPGSLPPEPHVVWDVSAIYDDCKSYDGLETNLNLSTLLALRICTSPSEEVFAIDLQHPWYRFQPHAFARTGDMYYWQVPVLPNGDAHFFLPHDFRFGIIGIPHSTICIYGADLLQAFAENQPSVFTKQIAWPRDPWPKSESELSENP